MSYKLLLSKSSLCYGFFVLIFSLFSVTLCAQNYPDRPIKLIVPFAPGGPNDLVARVIAPPLSEALKQTIIIENKAGAGGNIGTAFVAKAKPDGYTLLLTTSTVAANMVLYKDTGYDLEKELIGVVNIASAPNIYCVPKDSVITSMVDLLSNPKYTKINYATPGTGSTAHLGMAYLFKKSSKVDAVHIPYKGGAPAMNAVMASEVDAASAALPAAYTFVKANKIRALAVSSKSRLPHLPEVPTLTELGYPNQEITTWAGIFSPQSTPTEITNRINTEMNKILQNPQIKEKLLNSGFIVEGGSMQTFKETIHQELEFWKTVVQVTGSNLQ